MKVGGNVRVRGGTCTSQQDQGCFSCGKYEAGATVDWRINSTFGLDERGQAGKKPGGQVEARASSSMAFSTKRFKDIPEREAQTPRTGPGYSISNESTPNPSTYPANNALLTP